MYYRTESPLERQIESNKSDESDDLADSPEYFDFFTCCQKCRLVFTTGLATCLLDSDIGLSWGFSTAPYTPLRLLTLKIISHLISHSLPPVIE